MFDPPFKPPCKAQCIRPSNHLSTENTYTIISCIYYSRRSEWVVTLEEVPNIPFPASRFAPLTEEADSLE